MLELRDRILFWDGSCLRYKRNRLFSRLGNAGSEFSSLHLFFGGRSRYTVADNALFVRSPIKHATCAFALFLTGKQNTSGIRSRHDPHRAANTADLTICLIGWLLSKPWVHHAVDENEIRNRLILQASPCPNGGVVPKSMKNNRVEPPRILFDPSRELWIVPISSNAATQANHRKREFRDAASSQSPDSRPRLRARSESGLQNAQ